MRENDTEEIWRFSVSQKVIVVRKRLGGRSYHLRPALGLQTLRAFFPQQGWQRCRTSCSATTTFSSILIDTRVLPSHGASVNDPTIASNAGR